MSSPSSPAQKGLCEEDSSGSDGGSEVGHEPETDRFGFIVTNGCTAGSVGPPPELVRQREAKWLNIIGKWDLNMLKKYNKVKVLCQKGIPASLKSKCWPLLCAATERMKQSKDLYQSLDSQSALQSWVDVIERDLDRQFPFHEMFLSKDGHGQRGLFRVLKAYTQYQPEEGYCQAQGPVAAVLLMNMPAEEAFWCLVQISEQYLPGYYSPLLEGVLFDAAMLNWVLKRTCPAAHKHLQHHSVEPLMYATDWLMCLFTRHLPFNKLLRVWDLFFCYGVRVLLQVAVVLVRRVLGRAEQRKQCQGQMETLEKLRGVREQVEDEDDAFIAEVCSVPLSGKDIEKQTEKELQKWRKDRPASTFDPRVRCQGYQMVWGKARQNEQERDKKEREKGNLSVPLARSASTLSLSPSILHKKWRKGGKANTGEWEGGGKVVRHLSMGGNEDWKSWTELNLKKVQGVQEEEDTFTEEQKQQSETKLTGQTEQKESKKVDNIQNIQTEQVEETAKEENEVKTRITEEEDSELKESQESKTLAEQPEETNVETEPAKDPESRITEEEDSELKESQESKTLAEQPEETNVETEPAKDPESRITEEEDSELKESQESKTLAEQLEETNVETEPAKDPESRITEEEDSELKESLESETLAEQPEGTNVETEPAKDPAENQTVENILQQGEEPDSDSQSQDVEQQSHESNGEETDAKDTSEETEKQEVESEHKAAEEENLTEVQNDVDAETNTEVETDVSVELVIQADVKPEESTEIEIVQQTQVDAVTDVSETPTETSLGSETDSEAPPVTDPTAETETQQQQQEVIEETDNSSEDASEGKHLSTDSLAETDIKEESHTHTVTETDTLAQTQETVEENVAIADELEAEKDPKDSEQHRDSETEVETVISCEPENIPPNEGNDLVADTETQVEIPLSDDIARDSNEEFAQHSEEDCDTGAFEPPQETTERLITTNSEADNDQTKTEETPTETQIMEEAADSTTPPQEEVTSAQGEEVNLNTEPDGETNSVEMSTFEEPAPEELKIQATSGADEEARNSENVQEQNGTGQEVTISTEPTDSIIESKPQITDKESQLVKDQPELKNSDPKQASGQCSSFSSGDFRIRKSSSSRGSKLGRRLSEDFFTVPQKPSQSQSVPSQPEVKDTESQSNSGVANTTQTPSDVSQSSAVTSALSQEAADRKEEQQNEPEPSKRFGLFRRLRGEQPEKAKAKKKPKMQVPKILIQDFSDATGTEKPVEEEEKLSSRERRRRRRERERQEKEEERLRKKREKEVEKEKERRKPKTRGKSFQVQKEKGSTEEPQPEKTGSQTLRHSASYAESYF